MTYSSPCRTQSRWLPSQRVSISSGNSVRFEALMAQSIVEWQNGKCNWSQVRECHRSQVRLFIGRLKTWWWQALSFYRQTFWQPWHFPSDSIWFWRTPLLYEISENFETVSSWVAKGPLWGAKMLWGQNVIGCRRSLWFNWSILIE